jgi:hypothetical protein
MTILECSAEQLVFMGAEIIVKEATSQKGKKSKIARDPRVLELGIEF